MALCSYSTDNFCCFMALDKNVLKASSMFALGFMISQSPMYPTVPHLRITSITRISKTAQDELPARTFGTAVMKGIRKSLI